MRAPKCRSCDAKIEGKPSFCARCGEATQWATAEERRRHDLEKWRAHRQQAEAPQQPVRIPASVMQATGAAPPPPAEAVREESPHAVRRRSRPAEPRPAKPMRAKKAKTPRRAPKPAPVIDLDADNPFAYSACVSCHRTDWILRTGRNEDGSFRYWCLRCSRAFKTDVRLTHAVKPFVVSGSVLAFLTLLANIR